MRSPKLVSDKMKYSSHTVPQDISQADRAIGGQLATCLQSKGSRGASTTILQALVADLVGERSDLIVPLKDLVSRPDFQALIPLAGSGGGHLQRDALLQEIGRTFAPGVVSLVGDVLGGFLGIPAESTAAAPAMPPRVAGTVTNGSEAVSRGVPGWSAEEVPTTLMADDEGPRNQAAVKLPKAQLSISQWIGIAALGTLLTAVTVNVLHSPSVCWVLGQCPATTKAGAPPLIPSQASGQQANDRASNTTIAAANTLSKARRAEAAMRSGRSLTEHRQSLQELEQALAQLSGANLTPAQSEERRNLEQAAKQGRQFQDEEELKSNERTRLEQEESASAARRAAAAQPKPLSQPQSPRPSAPFREEPLW